MTKVPTSSWNIGGCPWPNELAIEILDAMSFVHHQELPVTVHQMTLVPHAYLIAGDHHRESIQLYTHVHIEESVYVM